MLVSKVESRVAVGANSGLVPWLPRSVAFHAYLLETQILRRQVSDL